MAVTCRRKVGEALAKTYGEICEVSRLHVSRQIMKSMGTLSAETYGDCASCISQFQA